MNTSANTPVRNTKIYKRVQISFDPKEGRTRQAHRDECDINKIMLKFQKTGAITHVANTQNNYGYASSLTFTEAMLTVATGQRMFSELPSSLRSKFHGNPAEFLAFVQDEANHSEMLSLGLLSPEATREHLLAEKAATAATDALPVDPTPPVDLNVPGSSE